MKNCFFAMFDIIGFSNLVKTKGTEAVFKHFNKSVMLAVQYAAMPGLITKIQNGRTVSVPDPSTQRVDYQIFSDTIIFFTKDDSLKSFFDIIGTAKGLLTFNFAGMIPAPYRGAIGYGDILTSLQSLIGTSIIDAYYGEQKQVWSGCMFTKKCETFCNSQNYFEILSKTFEQRSKDAVDTREKNIMKELESIVIQYEVPLQKKSGLNIEYYNEKHYVINWTHWVGEGRHIEQSFQESNILHHKKIKDNTIQFSKYAREKYKLN